MTALEIQVFILGPLDNNTCLLADPSSRQAVLVDPSLGSERLLPQIQALGWLLREIWLTHAHFDHTSGIEALFRALGQALPIGLHPADLPLYQDGGGAREFGLHRPPAPAPTFEFAHGQTRSIGQFPVEVRHAPGHTPGHILFHIPQSCTALVGDVIFAGSVGRTDLAGGSHAQLLESIHTQVLSLPPQTRLICGHGPATTVDEEARSNPFLRGLEL